MNATPDEPPHVIGRNFTSVSFTFSGAPTKGVRAVLRFVGGFVAEYGLDDISSGQILDITKFTTADAGTTVKSLTISDTPYIDAVGVRIPSGSAEIPVKDFCLSGVDFGMTGPAALTFDPPSLDLGPVADGETRAVQFTLHNGGPGPAAPLTITIDDPWAYTRNPAATTCKTMLAAGDSCVIGYTFTPTRAGQLCRVAAISPGGSAEAFILRY